MNSVILRDIALIFHFIGLAMGLGTSFAFMFLGIASTKMEPEAAKKFTLNTFALSKMGHIGLTLLVASGIILVVPYHQTLGQMPLFIAKLVLVVLLGAIIGVISSNAKKAQVADDPMPFIEKIKSLGRFSMLTSLAIVVLAILNFH